MILTFLIPTYFYIYGFNIDGIKNSKELYIYINKEEKKCLIKEDDNYYQYISKFLEENNKNWKLTFITFVPKNNISNIKSDSIYDISKNKKESEFVINIYDSFIVYYNSNDWGGIQLIKHFDEEIILPKCD